MDTQEYYSIIRNAEHLDRSFFNLSNKSVIDRLESILDEHSKKNKEPIVAVPLVQPYGGPAIDYILLPERKYQEIKQALISGELTQIHPRIGVPYDKKRININREQLQKKFDISELNISPAFRKLMGNCAENGILYKEAYSYH
jgi:hypothetical protein